MGLGELYNYGSVWRVSCDGALGSFDGALAPVSERLVEGCVSELRRLTFELSGRRRLGPRGATITSGASRAKPLEVRSSEGLAASFSTLCSDRTAEWDW